VAVIRGKEFRWGSRTYIMGIINLSPDSFSGDGTADLTAALNTARQMVKDGADIIDVGGESTRPGSSPISVEEELNRIIPFVSRAGRWVDVPICVDTYKPDVAVKALAAGAHMLNDVSGATRTAEMVNLAGEKGVPIVLMSNQRERPAQNIVQAVMDDLSRLSDMALMTGLPPEYIIIDPGIGFGKTQEQNLELIRRLDELTALKYPILLGVSRKSFIGAVLDMPVERRLEGTAAAVAIGISKGADIVRVHDVRVISRVCKMCDAIVRAKG